LLRGTFFVSAWQQNNQSNSNKKPDCDKQEGKGQASRGRRRGASTSAARQRKAANRQTIDLSLMAFRFHAKGTFAPSLDANRDRGSRAKMALN
jgi:hypothetical protein